MADEPAPEKLEKLNRLEALSNKDLKTVIDKGSHVHAACQLVADLGEDPGDKAYLIVDGEVCRTQGQGRGRAASARVT